MMKHEATASKSLACLAAVKTARQTVVRQPAVIACFTTTNVILLCSRVSVQSAEGGAEIDGHENAGHVSGV